MLSKIASTVQRQTIGTVPQVPTLNMEIMQGDKRPLHVPLAKVAQGPAGITMAAGLPAIGTNYSMPRAPLLIRIEYPAGACSATRS